MIDIIMEYVALYTPAAVTIIGAVTAAVKLIGAFQNNTKEIKHIIKADAERTNAMILDMASQISAAEKMQAEIIKENRELKKCLNILLDRLEYKKVKIYDENTEI